MSSSLPKQKKLIPISEAAKALGVSIDTIRRWDKSGVLHSERPDGKNRYFSLDELEQHKFCQPLSISEAATELGISPTTLRRLETRGLIKPKRNNAGERVYAKQLLKSFLNSDYLLRKKQIKEKILDPIEIPHLLARNEEVQVNLKPLQRLPELLAATVMFFLLLAIGITNISAPVVKSPLAFSFSIKSQAPAVLSQTAQVLPEATTEAKLNPPKLTVTIKLDGKASSINIRQKPTTSSRIIGSAKDGNSFELVSENSEWDEVKLASGSTGFISTKYIKKGGSSN